MRDLKLGINHIDREQLRRNALLSPRYPTELRQLKVSIERAMPAKDANVRVPGNPQRTVYKIRCVATVDLVNTEEIPDEVLQPYLSPDGRRAVTYKETWVVYRPFGDFQTLHKHLKSQVAVTESSGNAGMKLVGAATAALGAGSNRKRKALLPSLGQSVTQRSVTKRMEILDGYLHHLLASGHHLSRCPELLMFIGAFYPLAPEVETGKAPVSSLADPLGRAEMSREVLKFAAVVPESAPTPTAAASTGSDESIQSKSNSRRDVSQSTKTTSSKMSTSTDSDDELNNQDGKGEKSQMKNAAIVAKLDKVPLGKVRARIFELLSYQFGFENASFFRSQMLSALKTMSFAVTTPGEFRKTLYKTHVEHVSAEAIAYWINYGVELLWPNGVFFESSPALTPEEQKRQADKARELLHTNFPDQLRTVLGQELTRDGLDILHEMLQNRMVMKSMFYMMFDLLWEEVFPEMKDVLSCGDALDIDFSEGE